jgi:hypothetical protein
MWKQKTRRAHPFHPQQWTGWNLHDYVGVTQETRHVFGIGSYCLYFRPNTWYKYFRGWQEKSSVSDLDLWMQKNVFFFLQYGQVSCVLTKFLVGSALKDNTEYWSHFPETIIHVYCCLRRVRQHKSSIFGYSNSETIKINTWYRPVLSLFQCCSEWEPGG